MRALESLGAQTNLAAASRSAYVISMVISVARDGHEIGEWTEDQIRTFHRNGSLLGTDHYWHEGMSGWQPLRNLIKPAPPQPAARECAPPEPTARPGIQPQALREPTTAIEEAEAKMGRFADGWKPAAFRTRAMARMIDYFVLTLASGAALFVALLPVAIMSPPPMILLVLVVLIGYPISNALFFAWDWVWLALTGTSPGKWVYGMRIASSDGTGGITSRSSARRSYELLGSLWYLFAFPFLTFWFAASAEKRYVRTGATAWDAKAGTVVIGKKIGMLRTVVAVTLTVMSFLGILFWCAAARSSLYHP